MSSKGNKNNLFVQIIFTAILVILLEGMYAIYAQKLTLREYKFKKVKGVTIQIYTKEVFNQKFKDNPLIPLNNRGVIQLARKLYTRAGREQIEEECGESLFGALFASLTNPDISDNTRDTVDALVDADTPSLPDSYTSGHFKIMYTTSDSDPDNNSTLANIQDLALVLNNAWTDYVNDFIEPKHYMTGGGCSPVKKLIDVKVYDLGGSLYGQTASSWNYIELCSKKVVNNSCKRKTTPVHELFHRVEYSYGYVTGMSNMKWAVEGLASWSQKYQAPQVGDWMDRMNQGLNNPDIGLITSRSYDAIPFWIYLGRRGGGEVPAIRMVWSEYKTNGNKMKDAVVKTIQTLVPNGQSFDQFIGWWSFTNIDKDLNGITVGHDYEEDEWTRTCGGITHGPLVHVPRTNNNLTVGSNLSTTGTVTAYGTDYLLYNIAGNITHVEIMVTGTSNNFGYAVLEINGNNQVTYQRTPGGSNKNYSFTKNLSAGTVDKIALIIIGNPGGGNYSVTAKGS